MNYNRKFKDMKDTKICVIGLGYVGLPLALSFAEAGFYVTGFDKSEVKIALLKQGKSDILDISSDTVQMAFSTGHFQVSNQNSLLFFFFSFF